MRNIIITGGGLVNKGAQSMTFIAVSELKRRYPNHKIYVVSETDKKQTKEYNPYLFDFIGWYPLKFTRSKNNPFAKLVNSILHKEEYNSFSEIYFNCDLMIDISGYAFGSGWSEKIYFDYFHNFEIAKALGIPVYIMPQTFGPFDFDDAVRTQVLKKAEQLFSYAEVVFAREEESYRLMTEELKLKNVKKSLDLVLCNKSVDHSLVYRETPSSFKVDIDDKAVGVIPNERNIAVSDRITVVKVYADSIKHCLEKGYTVYVLSHSSADASLCRELKNQFEDNERVVCLDREFSCIEFNELVKKFGFIIASRFHSVVHSYKNTVPCVVIGWSNKYTELLSNFKQDKYMFDIRSSISEKALAEAIDNLIDCRAFEAEIISRVLKEVQKENVFDILPASLEKK